MGNLVKRCQVGIPECTTAQKMSRPLIGEKLTRNVLIATFVLACVVSARDMALSPDKNVLSVLQSAVESEWDENLGRLVYASNTLTDAIAVFSPAATTPQLYQPCLSPVADVFSDDAPYIVYQPSESVYTAAACEVISVSCTGNENLYTIRTYCDNGLECLYFGLSSCFVAEGDILPARAQIGACTDHSLVFEVRKNGVSIDASSMFISQQVQ